MEYKLFHEPRFHDEAHYVRREAVDHIHQDGQNLGHRIRLLEALNLIDDIVLRQDLQLSTLADWGAGTGGLLSEVKKHHDGLRVWGYDLCPQNVLFGQENYKLDLQLENIVEGDPIRAEIIVMTETLEHLVDPHRLLEFIAEAPPRAPETSCHETRWIVASVPGFEDHLHHYEHHLWAWTENSFPFMFDRSGWHVKRHFFAPLCSTQFVVACHPDIL